MNSHKTLSQRPCLDCGINVEVPESWLREAERYIEAALYNPVLIQCDDCIRQETECADCLHDHSQGEPWFTSPCPYRIAEYILGLKWGDELTKEDHEYIQGAHIFREYVEYLAAGIAKETAPIRSSRRHHPDTVGDVFQQLLVGGRRRDI